MIFEYFSNLQFFFSFAVNFDKLTQPCFLESENYNGCYRLFFKGFIFYRSYIGAKKLVWSCSQKNLGGCRARLSLSRQDGTIDIVNGLHNHLPRPIAEIPPNVHIRPITHDEILKASWNVKIFKT